MGESVGGDWVVWVGGGWSGPVGVGCLVLVVGYIIGVGLPSPFQMRTAPQMRHHTTKLNGFILSAKGLIKSCVWGSIFFSFYSICVVTIASDETYSINYV